MHIVIDKEELIWTFINAITLQVSGVDYNGVKKAVTDLVDIVGYDILPEGHGDLIDVNELNEFASNHDIASSALDGTLIYDAGETISGDTIWKPLIDELTVAVKAEVNKEVEEIEV